MAGDVVLLYHRVAELESDPQLLCVTPANMREHLAALRSAGYPIKPLAEIVSAPSPEPRVAITFDDGYADNLTAALPALQNADAVATVFVTTGNAEAQQEFWWDALEAVILGPHDLPPQLDVSLEGLRLSGTHNGAVPDAPAARPLAAGRDSDPRHSLYEALSEVLRQAAPDLRDRGVIALAEWAGCRLELRETHRPLRADEVAALSSGGIEIGAHTVDHPLLAMLPLDQQHRQISESRKMLREWTGAPVDSFSYPYGRRSPVRSLLAASRLDTSVCHYTRATVAAVREIGFSIACRNGGGPVRSWSHPLELERVLVRDWDGDEFMRRLSALAGLRRRVMSAVIG